MLPDRVSNPGPLTYESGALPIALRGPALSMCNLSASGYFSQLSKCIELGRILDSEKPFPAVWAYSKCILSALGYFNF